MVAVNAAFFIKILENVFCVSVAQDSGTQERLGTSSAGEEGAGEEAVAACAGQGTWHLVQLSCPLPVGARGGMPVSDDGSGAVEADGGGVRVEGREGAGAGGGASDVGAEDERGDLRPWG